MKFGLRYVDPARAVALMRAAEAAEFESAWTVQHVVGRVGIARRIRVRPP